MSNTIYQWVSEMTGLDSTQYSQSQCDREVETIIPVLIAEFSCLSDYASFSGSDLLLWNKGVACLVTNNLIKRGSVSITSGNITYLENSGDAIRFEKNNSYSPIPYLDEAWDCISKIACIVAGYNVLDSKVILRCGKRRSNRETYLYDPSRNPLYDVYSDVNEYDRLIGVSTI